MIRPSRFPPEVRDRAVRMVREHEHENDTQWAAITSIAEKLGCSTETLRNWLWQSARDQGQRPGWANEILRLASAYFAKAELDRRGE